MDERQKIAEITRQFQTTPHCSRCAAIAAIAVGLLAGASAGCRSELPPVVAQPRSLEPRYPDHWWTAVSREGAPDWEILPQEAKPGEVILSKRHELGLLSNFAATPFTFRGKRYGSLEGFWQMMKFPEGSDDPREVSGIGLEVHARRGRPAHRVRSQGGRRPGQPQHA